MRIAAQEIDNQTGLIEAEQALALNAGSITNGQGTVISLADSELRIEAAEKLENQAGIIGGNGKVTIAAGDLDNSNGGEISAKQDVTLTIAEQLHNDGGAVLAGNDLSVEQLGGGITNTEGALQAGRDLLIFAGTTDISGGEFSANENITIGAGSFAADKLQAGKDVAIQAAADVTVHTAAQAGGNLTVGAGGTVTNSGRLTALKGLQIHSGSLNNEDGAAITSGSQLDLVQQEVRNQGTIYSKGRAMIAAQDQLTTSGVITSNTDIDITGGTIVSTGTLAAGLADGGALGSSGNLTLLANGSLTATGKTLAGGSLSLQGTTVDIRGAETYSGHTAVITATVGDMDNSGGKLTANDSLTIVAANTLVNDAAETRANQLQLTAKDITNRSGLLAQYGQSDFVLNTGKLDNTGGEIAANSGNLAINASELDNSQGQIQHAGSGKLSVTASGDLLNNGGQMISNGALALKGRQIDNGQGTLSAQGALTAKTDNLDNRSGVMVGSGDVSLEITNALANQNGTVEAGQGLTLSAGTIQNENGKLISLDQSGLHLTVADALNNRQGLIGSNGAANIRAKTLDNTGGQIVSADNLLIEAAGGMTNTSGELTSGQDLTLVQQAADFINEKGAVQAGRKLDIQAVDVHNAQGKLAAKDLNVTATGTVTNSGTMEAEENLDLSAQQVDNQAGGTLAANDNVNVTAVDDVHNGGSLFGRDINVLADNIVNAGETAAIAATDSVNLYAKTGLDNQDGALIYSMGNIDIAGSKEQENGEYTTRAKTLTNQSANIEADGDIVIYADEVVNKKQEFETAQTIITDGMYPLEEGGRYGIIVTGLDEMNALDGFLRYDLQIESWGHEDNNKLILYRGQSRTKTQILKDSPEGKIVAGRNLTLQATNTLNDNSWLLAGKNLFSKGNITNQAFSGNSKTIKHYALASFEVGNEGDPYLWAVSVDIDFLYDEVVDIEIIPGSSSTALFGGGQQVVIDGTSVSNVIVTPGWRYLFRRLH
ncbi:hypothetical protein P22_2695 [Propionispora sp. 2/2-37]|nr:hypothetical protein P22_2695 [Propionispora sp. 2/2-37]